MAEVFDESRLRAIEGNSPREFLQWAAHESGRVLFFEDGDLRMAAMRTQLRGFIETFRRSSPHWRR